MQNLQMAIDRRKIRTKFTLQGFLMKEAKHCYLSSF